MPLTLRQAGLDDLGQLVPLFDAYRGFYGQPSDPAVSSGFLHQRIEQDQQRAIGRHEFPQAGQGATSNVEASASARRAVARIATCAGSGSVGQPGLSASSS